MEATPGIEPGYADLQSAEAIGANADKSAELMGSVMAIIELLRASRDMAQTLSEDSVILQRR